MHFDRASAESVAVRGERESAVAQGMRELDRARERGFQYARCAGARSVVACRGAGNAAMRLDVSRGVVISPRRQKEP